MKNNKYISLTLAAGSLLAGGCFSSCEQDAVSELQNVYKAPQKIKIVSASGLEKVGGIVDGKRTFKVEFSSDQGDTFQMTFITGKYFLAGGGYTLSKGTTTADSEAGTYLKGSTVNGVELMDGTFNLSASAVDGVYYYSFNECSLFDVEGNAYTITGSDGLIAFSFTPDAADEVSMCNNVNKMEAGWLSLELITPGYECDESGWPPVYIGTGGINWNIKFSSANGRLEAGDYAALYYSDPSATYYNADGSTYKGDGNYYYALNTPYGIYADNSRGAVNPLAGKYYIAGTASALSGAMCEAYGFGFNQDCSWGGNTCVSTYSGVSGKCPDRTNLASTIHVERSASNYHIYTDPTAESWIEFRGDIELCNPELKLGEDYTLDKLFAIDNQAMLGEGLHYVDVTMALGNVSVDNNVYSGTGRILKFRLQSEDGKLANGEYAFVKDYKDFKKNTCLSSESSLLVINDGDVTTYEVTGDKLTVSYDETTKAYTIFLQYGEDTYKYVGELTPKVELVQYDKKVNGNEVTLSLYNQEGYTMQLVLNTAEGVVTKGSYTVMGETATPGTYVATGVDWQTYAPTGAGTWIKDSKQNVHWMWYNFFTGTPAPVIEITDGPYPTTMSVTVMVDDVKYVGLIY